MGAMGLNCLAVGAGGAVGAVFRYLVGQISWLRLENFPLPTLLVNLVGAFLIGLITKAAQSASGMDPHLLLFLQVGLCGGFTTFSTFSLECLSFLEAGQVGRFGLYALLSLVLCLAGVALGRAVG